MGGVWCQGFGSGTRQFNGVGENPLKKKSIFISLWIFWSRHPTTLHKTVCHKGGGVYPAIRHSLYFKPGILRSVTLRTLTSISRCAAKGGIKPRFLFVTHWQKPFHITLLSQCQSDYLIISHGCMRQHFLLIRRWQEVQRIVLTVWLELGKHFRRIIYTSIHEWGWRNPSHKPSPKSRTEMLSLFKLNGSVGQLLAASFSCRQ